MHELTVVASIVEKVLHFAAKQQAERVLSVYVQVGELAHLDAEQMKFCFEAITQHTPLEGSSLEIERIPAGVTCRSCSYQGRPNYWDQALFDTPVPTLQCPQCGKTVEIVGGQECAIQSVKYLGDSA